jgi:hypothetical protein
MPSRKQPFSFPNPLEARPQNRRAIGAQKGGAMAFNHQKKKQ